MLFYWIINCINYGYNLFYYKMFIILLKLRICVVVFFIKNVISLFLMYLVLNYIIYYKSLIVFVKDL